MDKWNITNEEASIVLVGNFNPAIFHPEWFIRKNCIPEWDWQSTKEQLIVTPDLARFMLPDEKLFQALLEQCSFRTPRATEFVNLRDLAVNTFTFLRETPVRQLGMNYTSIVSFQDKNAWMNFSNIIAPKETWKNIGAYLQKMGEESESFGLINMTMQLPRPDKLSGYIRITVSAYDVERKMLSINVNNHIEAVNGIQDIIHILGEHWDTSLSLAKELRGGILKIESED